MPRLHLITVGKLKDTAIKQLENEYLKRLTSATVSIHELKAFGGNKEQEAKEVVKKLQELKKEGSLYNVICTEHGKQFTSLGFAGWLKEVSLQAQQIALIIGGAEGHGEEVIKEANLKLSLSELTFPHQLARLLLIEQIYRAQSLWQGHPYHK